MHRRHFALLVGVFLVGCREAPAPPSSQPAPAPPSDRRELVWLDQSGKRTGSLNISGRIRLARLSPDGSTVAWIDDEGQVSVEPTSGGPAQTVGAPGTRGLAWSPDGTRLAVDAPVPRPRLLLFRLADHHEEELAATGMSLGIGDWSRDGDYLTYSQDGGPKKSDLWLLYLKDQGLPVPQVTTSGEDRDAMFSPDGRAIAYTSERDGRDEVFIQILPNAAISMRVSFNGGSSPRWAASGRELYYSDSAGTLMAADITPAPSLATGSSRALFPLKGATLQQVVADGRFLVLAPAP